MLIKFKWLIASALKASLKFAYLRRVDCRLQISQSQGPKVSKEFNNSFYQECLPAAYRLSPFLPFMSSLSVGAIMVSFPSLEDCAGGVAGR